LKRGVKLSQRTINAQNAHQVLEAAIATFLCASG